MGNETFFRDGLATLPQALFNISCATFFSVNVIVFTGAKKRKVVTTKTAGTNKQDTEGKDSKKEEGSTFRGKVLIYLTLPGFNGT